MQPTSEKMQLLLSKWQESGLNKKAFCKAENISYATFHYWAKRLSKVNESGFSEIPLKSSPAPCCELIFPSGVRMVFDSTPPLIYLKELLF